MRDIVRVDGLPDTVAASLRHGVRSPRIVACPLRMSNKSAPYCHRHAALMSYMHLMPAIRCVWLVTYVFNVLFAPRAWRGHNEPDVRRLRNARARPWVEGHWTRVDFGALPHREAGLEPHDTWRYRSPASGGPGASVTW
jgi:hypothetical protein